jgi:hypothetical protein
MLHKDYDHKGPVAKTRGLVPSQTDWRQTASHTATLILIEGSCEMVASQQRSRGIPIIAAIT